MPTHQSGVVMSDIKFFLSNGKMVLRFTGTVNNDTFDVLNMVGMNWGSAVSLLHGTHPQPDVPIYDHQRTYSLLKGKFRLHNEGDNMGSIADVLEPKYSRATYIDDLDLPLEVKW
jgi:hypothetical protein